MGMEKQPSIGTGSFSTSTEVLRTFLPRFFARKNLYAQGFGFLYQLTEKVKN